MHHKAFQVHESSACTARDVCKLFARDERSCPVQIWDQEYRSIEVEALGQSGRRHRHSQHPGGKQSLHFTQKGTWQSAVMYGNSDG